MLKCKCGIAASAIPLSAARRPAPGGGAGLQACVNRQQNRTALAHEVRSPFENLPPPLYKSHYAPSARQPHPRPHAPAPRPHRNRRRPAPGRSIRSSPLHHPPSLPKPASHGGSSRHRISRPPAPTPPPSRSSQRRAILGSATLPRPTPPKRRRRSFRHSRSLRRRPPPEPSPDADLRPGRRNLLRHQRSPSPKSPPHPSSLK